MSNNHDEALCIHDRTLFLSLALAGEFMSIVPASKVPMHLLALPSKFLSL